MWDEMLAEPPPNPKLVGLSAGYHYGMASALAVKGRVQEAKVEQQALEKIAAALTADDPAGLNAAKDVLAVALLVSEARIADAEAKPDEAIRLLTEASAKEDALAYDEPSDWFFPVRHLLGAALLKAGKAPDAEAVYREDLRRHPENGWALLGLRQALTAQHKDAEALDAQRRFEAAWTNADMVPVASAF
jgi:tetratricopeptide (TPR) repeat protein